MGAKRRGRRYEFALEVRVPGVEPYTVRDSFRVPRRVGNTGFFSRAKKLEVGLEGASALVLARPSHQGEDEGCGACDDDGGDLSEFFHATECGVGYPSADQGRIKRS